ncbi:DUF262 domain-containing protein [Treponema peruense]|uniref:DUF262 domain-containing protein n=1 Tax=Treponema peruense TaxID=2787628 RepID=A0A7T3REW8_9SPIR|nr:DUF262 domain-containing protein [Treponema peruense]QQA01805.1 DUF262 domain-containing protein [Treponema peruense]
MSEDNELKQEEMEQTQLDSLEFDKDEKEYDSKGPEIKEPYDPDKVDIIPNTMTIRLLLDRIEHDEIDLNPDFQRKSGLWDETKKSRLIESMLIKIPLPVFYFDSRIDEKWTIVDGLQRITTLNEFIVKKSLRLTNLEYLNEFQDYSYDDLPRNMQRRIQECQIQAYCIRKGTPDDVTISIFKRINTGGLVLSLAEIRNCIFHGIAGNLVKDMANLDSFKEATRYRISPERMADRDLATRFTAFYVLGYETYDGNMDLYLEKGLTKVKKEYSNEKVKELLSIFDRTMKCCKNVFGNYAFRKKILYTDVEKYGPLNKSLFECVSSCFGLLTSEEQDLIVKNKEDFFADYKKLFDSPFYWAINSATGLIDHVRMRHQELTNLLNNKLRSYK